MNLSRERDLSHAESQEEHKWVSETAAGISGYFLGEGAHDGRKSKLRGFLFEKLGPIQKDPSEKHGLVGRSDRLCQTCSLKERVTYDRFWMQTRVGRVIFLTGDNPHSPKGEKVSLGAVTVTPNVHPVNNLGGARLSQL